MREYTIREESMYSGIHLLYENEKEFRSSLPHTNVKLHTWAVDDYREYTVGDYIQAEDGYIVQILVIKEMKSKKQRKGRTVFIRFPMGTFAVYEKADGTVNYPRFYAQFTTGDKGSAGGRSRSNFTGSKDEAKRRFANMIFQGFDKRNAFRIAFDYYRIITPSQIEGKITKLLQDKLVLSELRKLMDPQQVILKKEFPDDMLLSHIKELLKYCKKGSPQHRKSIEFILALRGIV